MFEFITPISYDELDDDIFFIIDFRIFKAIEGFKFIFSVLRYGIVIQF